MFKKYDITLDDEKFFNKNNTLKEEWTKEKLQALPEDERYAFWSALAPGGFPFEKRKAICDSDEFPNSSKRVNEFTDWYRKNGDTLKSPH